MAIEIDEPVTKSDFDDIRWYTAHRGVSVFVEDGCWYVNFATRCNFLNSDNKCDIYETRPKICRNHDRSECEGPDGHYCLEIEFRHPREVEEYYTNVVKPKLAAKRKRKARKKK